MSGRSLISLLIGAAAAWSLLLLSAPAWTQKSTTGLPRIGIINHTPTWEPFDQRLRELGDIDGQTVSIYYRSGDSNPERLAEAAEALVNLPVDVIATPGTPPTRAAQKATDKIPIVGISMGDPIRAGLVANLAKPGGNITGNTIFGAELTAKRLQVLQEAVPNIHHVGLLWNPDNLSHVGVIEQLAAAAPQLGLTFTTIPARDPTEFDTAFAAIRNAQLEALIVTADQVHHDHMDRIIAFLAESRLPGMFQTRDAVLAGALMCYGAKQPDLFRRGAEFVHKILRGARAADLPVEQPVSFELVINLSTAKTLGLNIPRSLLNLADEVIE